MYFSELAVYFQKLEETDSRNRMTEILADLFRVCKPDEIDKICYLSLGKLVPQYEDYDFKIAEKMMLEILSKAYGIEKNTVQKLSEKEGDLGIVAEKLALDSGNRKHGKLSIDDIFQLLWEVAGVEGSGSVEKKTMLMADLINNLDPQSVKYIVRIPIKNMRLGFSDMTILDALSHMEKGDKSLREEIESFFNISADIGRIAKVFKESGLKGLADIKVTPGTPIRTAAAERLPNAEAIIKKMGKVAVEPKFDGFRVQVHKHKNKVSIFSRNLENTTEMFPEITEAAQKLRTESIIFEGEAIAYNPETQEYLPFQETVQRKRKYDITDMAKKVPLRVFVFDLLYYDDEVYIYKPEYERRERLEQIIVKQKNEVLELAEQRIVEKVADLEAYFQEKISQGLEGVMVKKIDAPYKAGARDFSWVKYKREDRGQLGDTIDCLIMGYYYGRGKRSDFGIGALLVGVYDSKGDTFTSIAKIGTGLTDEQWKEIKNKCDEIKTDASPVRYVVDKLLAPDVWISPQLITVVRADEITRSPLHSAGKVNNENGYALRFPRVMELLRSDKKPEDATTVDEIKNMNLNQQKAQKG